MVAIIRGRAARRLRRVDPRAAHVPPRPPPRRSGASEPSVEGEELAAGALRHRARIAPVTASIRQVRDVVTKLLRSLRLALAELADASLLADLAAQVVELCAVHVTDGRDLDLVDLRRMQRERALDADAERVLTDGERSRTPAPWRRNTTPSKTWIRWRLPSMTRKWTRTVSPALKRAPRAADGARCPGSSCSCQKGPRRARSMVAEFPGPGRDRPPDPPHPPRGRENGSEETVTCLHNFVRFCARVERAAPGLPQRIEMRYGGQ